MKIAIYCPDRHIAYNGSTPDTVGVGGGITVRIRLAAAFAALGHQVELICNCPENEVHQGVSYRPLDSVSRIEADTLLLHTSGGGQDLSPLRNVELRVGLRVLMLSGPGSPIGWEELDPDLLIAPSNFVLERARSEWTTLPRRLMVSPHGIERTPDLSLPRNESAIIYSSHPCKGLYPTIYILRLLRDFEPAFHLNVYGGNRLWGGPDEPVAEPGVFYHGLRPQVETIDAYAAHGFSLHLQTREEPFGLAVIEAMAGGCIVIASPVGAFSEIVCDGVNGYFVDGDPDSPATHRRTADLMIALRNNPDLVSLVKGQARAFPVFWKCIARSWIAYWKSLLTGSSLTVGDWVCPGCGGRRFALGDGYHCWSCGRYSRSLAAG